MFHTSLRATEASVTDGDCGVCSHSDLQKHDPKTRKTARDQGESVHHYETELTLLALILLITKSLMNQTTSKK